MKMTFVSDTLKQAGLPEEISKVDPRKIADLFKTQIEFLVGISQSMNLQSDIVRKYELPKDDDAQDKNHRHLYEVLANPYLAGMMTAFVSARTVAFFTGWSPVTFSIDGMFIAFTRHVD